jgi:hypothetical protein
LTTELPSRAPIVNRISLPPAERGTNQAQRALLAAKLRVTTGSVDRAIRAEHTAVAPRTVAPVPGLTPRTAV